MKNNTRQNAQGKWQGILKHFGFTPKQLGGQHQACPMCGGVDRWRYSDHDGNGSYFCSGCGPGSGFDLLMGMHDWDYARAAKEVDHMLGTIPSNEPFKPKVDVEKRRRDLNSLWKGADKDYRRLDDWWVARGMSPALLSENLLRDLRYHSGMFMADSNRKHDGMVALVRNKDAVPVSVHRTYFDPKTRKMMPPTENIKGAAVRLGLLIEETVVVGEGIETTLCGCCEYGFPGLAAISALGMETLEIPPPHVIPQVIILADNDHSFTGQKAAFTLARRLDNDGHKVRVIVPSEAGWDYNDVARDGYSDLWEFANES